MKIIGHPLVEHEKFVKVDSIDDIGSVEACDTVLIQGENFLQIAKHCSKNSVKYASKIEKIEDALLLNALNAKYIIAEFERAKLFQKLADEYMFDSKILCVVETGSDLERVALEFIDGVIYKGVLDGEL